MTIKYLFYFLLTLITCQTAISQDKKDISPEMLVLQESNFVQLNKSYFYGGERVWFKAFMLYADVSLQDSLSKILYVDLITPEKKVIRQMKFPINNSGSFGDFNLSDTLKSGNYFLRVYTNWMRNYGDSTLQYYPIRIIEKDLIPLSNALIIKKCDYLSSIPDTISVDSKINWQVIIPDLKQYSFSVTDTFYVKIIKENYQFKLVSSFPSDRQFDLIYPLERTLSVQAQFETKKNKKVKFTILRKSNNEFSNEETDEKGNFSYSWLGENQKEDLVLNVDTKIDTKINISKKKDVIIYLPIVPSLIFEPLKTKYYSKDTIVKNAIALQEVRVKAIKIEQKMTAFLYGKPDNVVKGEDIQQAQVDNPLMALQGRVPGLRILFMGGEMFIDIRGSSQSSFSGKITNPLILVDGVPFASESLNQVAAISPYTIQRIEVVKSLSTIMGSRASSGVINIITKNQGFQNSNNNDLTPNHTFRLPLQGFEKSNPFQSNEGQLCWQTNNQPIMDGKVDISFQSGLRKAVYLVELVGTLKNGNLIKCSKYISVQ